MESRKTFIIEEDWLQKLVERKADTRVGALRQIRASLKNNIPFKTSQTDGEELLVVNLDVLARHLIRWFQFRPVIHEDEVLDLLSLILSKRGFVRRIVTHISAARLKKELEKIQRLVLSEESLAKLENITQVLTEYEESMLIDVADRTGSFSDVDSPQFSSMYSSSISLIERNRRALTPSPARSTSSVFSKCQEVVEEVEAAPREEHWEILDGADLDRFNGIKASLTIPIHRALNLLRSSIEDYPVEFFLQPPFILEALVKVVQNAPNDSTVKIIKEIRLIINALRERCAQSNTTASNEQDSFGVKKQINNVIRMLIGYFEKFHDKFSFDFVSQNQELLNEVYSLLFDLVRFIFATQKACEIFVNELLNAMAKVAKDLRLSYSTDATGMTRLHYIIVIYTLNTLVASINVSGVCDSNVWELETDVALLDIPLKISHPKIYSLIKSNRINVIQDDRDLTVLLNSQQYWKPVVNLFQNWQNLSAEEIIFDGANAISTMRIHKNLELVDLLLTTIEKSSPSFGANQELKEVAEEIFIRLISVDVLEIRQKTYQIARKKVQTRMQDQDGCVDQQSLSSIFGIPITTEIVTEILCFGFTDADESIQDSAKVILFALLRSKMIYTNHWKHILEIIKPILPLMTCLISIHEKMGEFTFDIYRQQLVFESHELNRAYARFLYCDHQKMRESAKVKLLESLGMGDDFIQIVPDDFFLIQDQLVTKLQMPEERVGFNEEGYEQLRKVLETMSERDSELVQSVLLQLSVMMNSKAMCVKSHDDNLWVFFMASLEMGNPNSATIRKLTINILYKWVVCVPSFRIYLSNEPTILEFLVKTLIYFQEEIQLKLQASCLMFLLLFSDFIVTTGKSTSMPRFLSTLSCPFRFEHHWTESPFNKITEIEQLFEAMESNEEAPDIREMSKNYLKFTFALECFKVKDGLTEATDNYNRESFYKKFGSQGFKICENLQINEIDAQAVQHSDIKRIVRRICDQLDDTSTVLEAQHLTSLLKSLLMVSFKTVRTCVELIDKTIDRLTVYSIDNKCQQKMFIGFLQIYEMIMKWMSDERIVNVFNKKFIRCMLMDQVAVDEDAYLEALKVINCIVKLCHARPTLMALLIKNFEQQYKVYLPSRIVETFSSTYKRLYNKKWHEINEKPTAKEMLNVIRNVLKFMPIHLDDIYLIKIVTMLVDSTLGLYKGHLTHLKTPKPLHVHSSTLRCILSFVEVIASKVKALDLTTDCMKLLLFWANTEWWKHKTLSWLIIGHLTKNKENFAAFCKTLEQFNCLKLFDAVSGTILTAKRISNWTKSDQGAVAVVMANILDHDNFSETVSGFNVRAMDSFVGKLVELDNTSALSFVVRKLVQNDVTEAISIVINRDIIAKLLRSSSIQISSNNEIATYQNVSEIFETISVCFKHKPLKNHVAEVVASESKANFMMLLCDSKCSDEAVCKRFNISAFNLMLIMMQSDAGLKRIGRMLAESSVIDQMMFASHDNLRITNPHNELMFQLGFWISLLDACDKFDSPIVGLLSSRYVEVASGKFMISTPLESGDKSKIKFGTIMEKNINSVCHAIDLLFLQIVSIFDFVYSSKFSAEYKHDLKASCFVIIRKLSINDRVRQVSSDIGLMATIFEKLDLSLAVMQTYRFLETTKKNGVQKCQFMIKDLCIFLKALIEWQLPLSTRPDLVLNLFTTILKVHDWIKADSFLTNCFLNLLRVVAGMENGVKCMTEEVDGKPIIKVVLGRTIELSKPPHTETGMALMRNGIEALKAAARYVEVRAILKNSKVFSMLEVLHPQIGSSKRSSWDDITLDWLAFFEFLSRFKDTECLPNRISLLCRLFRIGSAKIKLRSLVIVRNFSMNSSIGFILINSEDFKATVDTIMEDSSDTQEKLIILQTLLNIATASEQLKAKMKNSPLNRKLKLQLKIMQSDSKFVANPENTKILHLTSVLDQVLYPDG